MHAWDCCGGWHHGHAGAWGGLAQAAVSTAERGGSVDEISPLATQVLAAGPAVDLHTHVGGIRGEPAPTKDIAGPMRKGAMAAICHAHIPDALVVERTPQGLQVPSRVPARGELYKHSKSRLDWVDKMALDGAVRRVLSPAELGNAFAQGQPAFLQDVEGCDFIEGKLARVEEYYRRGVRLLQLVHYTPNDLGDFQSGQPQHGGLTELGARAIRECDRLGIVVDVAHGTWGMVKGAVKAATRPLLLSHTALSGSRAMGPTPLAVRQISADHARAIAETGGIVGIWYFFADVAKYAQGIREMVDVVGVEHVGIATDQDVRSGTAFQDYSRFPHLVSALLGTGFTTTEVGKIIGGNFLRLFRVVAGRS